MPKRGNAIVSIPEQIGGSTVPATRYRVPRQFGFNLSGRLRQIKRAHAALAMRDPRAVAPRIVRHMVEHLLTVKIIVDVHNMLRSSKREHILSPGRAVTIVDIARYILIARPSAKDYSNTTSGMPEHIKCDYQEMLGILMWATR